MQRRNPLVRRENGDQKALSIPVGFFDCLPTRNLAVFSGTFSSDEKTPVVFHWRLCFLGFSLGCIDRVACDASDRLG